MPTTKKKVAKKTTKAKKVAKKALKRRVKKAAKKVAKKTTRRKRAEKPLVFSSDSTSFWVSNGQVLNNLISLRDAFEAMDKEIYKFHATGKENDFANWVETVLRDKKCATALRKAKTQKGARTIVIRHLKYYSV